MLSKAPLLSSFSLSPLRCGVPPRPQPPPPPATPPPTEERPRSLSPPFPFSFPSSHFGTPQRPRSAAALRGGGRGGRGGADSSSSGERREREFLFPSLSSAAFAADLQSPKDREGGEEKFCCNIASPPFPPPTEKNFECKCDASAGERRKGGQ